MSRTLSPRALNRATLQRQLLLSRVVRPVGEVLEHLVGLQAQAPNAPYVGLWSRLANFAPQELADLITGRAAVRTTLMRATIHLVTARDCHALRPVIRPVVERVFAGSVFARKIADLDVDELLAVGRKHLAEQPLTRAELGPLLARRWPGQDVDALAYTISYGLPLVQVPPRGVWGETGPAAWTPVESWLGPPAGPAADVDEVVLRYLAAFGPASTMDVQAWSGLTRLREVLERLRSRLHVFRDESGRELFDLPDAPRPDPDTPAPVRFLPEYDNVLLGHADRSRFVLGKRPVVLFAGNGATMGNLLLDGCYQGTWRTDRARRGVTLFVDPFGPLSTQDAGEVVAEAGRLLAFLAADAVQTDVVINRPIER
ncbi:winged helix DNA-binding domain-containing protein [Actinophytocola sp.]|uniref:winged helix DNA-binding domain-containing protein n=1 Tax=Actinophytocola sp. TaxID=1872138 RepID=UPI002D7E1F49|nr:winged helix DNA-binding domain-containing protein [Actinophytocola sp.]HET9138063.1 winged helix DNA-binding domain-containing protein [Actinophytocola sp.]